VSTPGTEVQPAGWYSDPAGQARFRYWDGRSWTHQTTNAKDPSAAKPVLGTGFARLSDWLSRCLMLVALSAVAVCGAFAWMASVFNGYLDTSVSAAFGSGQSGIATPEPVNADGPVIAVLVTVAVYGVSALVTGLLWCVWQYRLAAAAPGELRRGAGMQIVSWFIPILNYWWPFQNMADVWNAYGIPGDRADREQASGIGMWWAAYLGLPFVVGFLGGFWVVSAPGDGVFSRIAVLYGAVFICTMVSAILARGVVRRLSWRALLTIASISA
jgi:hypothetical protein